MKPFLIVNPKSANGATGARFDTIVREAAAALGEHPHAFTARAMHAAELARTALGAGHDLIIACGGDGTINEVVNGFFDAGGAPLNARAALGIIPRGTGGDLRRSVGLDGVLRHSVERLRREAKPLDAGRVDFTNDDGTPGTRYFVNVGEVGVGARVVELANASSKLLGGKLTFKLASLRALAGWHDLKLRVSFDGAPAEELDVTTLAIANGRYFGGGMMVAPEAKLDDGLFHVTVWSGFTLKDFILKGSTMYDGTHVKLSGTRTRTARTVRVEGDASAGVEVDGERVGRLPATFTVLPGALRIVC